ncbi:hypothetical protein [Paracoccus bogoriensis]|uniref:hypothetical protein n=1 Tax=Paracoccus bogoriensis TaxID=242065 RepID=UPI001CA5B80D|nr:hypothetical protein [Paracoccus bogoriensis]
MARFRTILYGGASALFLVSGMSQTVLLAERWPGPEASVIRAYLAPDSGLMWALLLAIWAMVALDLVGQWTEPSQIAGVTLPVTAALVLAAVLPWIALGQPVLLLLGLTAATLAALAAARRAVGRHRPAIGFLAGWLTALTSAALAMAVAGLTPLSMGEAAALAVLPAAAFGAAAQTWIGPAIGYSAALIWAFCALAVSTMGTDPRTAIAATLGIAAMTVVLVRAAS